MASWIVAFSVKSSCFLNFLSSQLWASSSLEPALEQQQ